MTNNIQKSNKEVLQRSQGKPLAVGHADTADDAAYNDKLSFERAKAHFELFALLTLRLTPHSTAVSEERAQVTLALLDAGVNLREGFKKLAHGPETSDLYLPAHYERTPLPVRESGPPSSFTLISRWQATCRGQRATA